MKIRQTNNAESTVTDKQLENVTGGRGMPETDAPHQENDPRPERDDSDGYEISTKEKDDTRDYGGQTSIPVIPFNPMPRV